MADQRRHNATLDGLRGVAAFAVVAYHLMGSAGLPPFPFRAYLAVDFFFVLSGFVIGRAYEDRLRNGMPILEFVRVRLFRLYPLIALAIALGFLSKMISYLHFSQTCGCISFVVIGEAVACGLVLIPFTGMYGTVGQAFPLDPPTWSLMFEIWTNLFYALAVRLLTTRRLIAVIGVGAVALMAASALNHGLDGGPTVSSLGVGLARVWFSFFMGVLLQRVLTNEVVASIPRVPVPFLAGVLLLSFMPGEFSFGALYDAGVALILFPMIIALGATDPVSSRWKRPALLAGTMSYPIYVLHYPLVVHYTHFHALQGSVRIGLVMGSTVIVLGFSYMATRLYDEPLRKWLTTLTSKRPIAALAAD